MCSRHHSLLAFQRESLLGREAVVRSCIGVGCSCVGRQISEKGKVSTVAVVGASAAAATDATRETDDGSQVVPIAQLVQHGVAVGDVRRLELAGYHCVEAVCFATKRALMEVHGITDEKADRFRTAASQLVTLGFATAADCHQMRARLVRITTGSKELDRLLQGGVEIGSLIEVFGEARSGKTQLCHTLAVTCQLPVDLGGGAGKCLYIDTESTFRPERCIAVAKRYGLSAKDVLDNITHARAYNVDHQTQLVVGAIALMSESRYALVVVDTATSQYRVDYQGVVQLAQRQAHLSKFLHHLQRLADQFGVAVVCTNQMTANLDSGVSGEANKPVGGDVMAYASTTRLGLRRGANEQRICKVYKSPTLPESEAVFAILPGGIGDVADVDE